MKRPNDIKAKFIVYYGSSVVGQTSAFSEKQAINNVRHNLIGETGSQYSEPGMWKAKENIDLQEESRC